MKISNHADLLLSIMHLRSEKLRQEAELKYIAKEFVCTFSPVAILKESIHEFSQDSELRFDIAKVGLNIGANFLIDKVVGRNRSIKGFLSSMLIEKISSVFIGKNAPSIISGISKLINSKSS